MDTPSIVNTIFHSMTIVGNPNLVDEMERYMKYKFQFLGV